MMNSVLSRVIPTKLISQDASTEGPFRVSASEGELTEYYALFYAPIVKIIYSL